VPGAGGGGPAGRAADRARLPPPARRGAGAEQGLRAAADHVGDLARGLAARGAVLDRPDHRRARADRDRRRARRAAAALCGRGGGAGGGGGGGGGRAKAGGAPGGGGPGGAAPFSGAGGRFSWSSRRGARFSRLSPPTGGAPKSRWTWLSSPP